MFQGQVMWKGLARDRLLAFPLNSRQHLLDHRPLAFLYVYLTVSDILFPLFIQLCRCPLLYALKNDGRDIDLIILGEKSQ